MRIILIAALAAAFSGCVHATIDQRRVFEGARPCSQMNAAPAATLPLSIDTGSILVADDLFLKTVTLRPAKPRGTLIYFGGNAIRHCADVLRDTASATLLRNLASLELNIVLVNYRGYGGSQGQPTFDVVREDAFVVYDAVVASDLAAPIMVHGQSLGTLFAATLAGHRPVSRVVLESPSQSTLPVVARVYQPTLVLVGSRDPITPPDMARRVHDGLASKQKDLRIIRNGRHGDLVDFADYWNALRSFVHGPAVDVSHH